MGVFTKSLAILLIAISTPLLYRQFANDNTIKFMSSYYSNYKSIDSFLRQSAGHLDRAKDYLPDQKQLKEVVDKVQQQINTLIISAKSKNSEPNEKSTKGKTERQKDVNNDKTKIEKPRLVQCPDEKLQGKEIRLWSKEELAKFDGKSGDQDVYLGFLGLVYNVTINQQHYASGAEYNAFAGRDATRAFVTGNFTHDLHDDIRDIDVSLYAHIDSWASFYSSSYPVLGRIEGQFYDSRGCATLELARVQEAFTKIEQDKANQRDEDRVIPECNSEWNSDLKQGKVWCSTKSGGIDREWTGVPRLYNNGKTTRCACYNLDGPDAAELAQSMSIYPGCDHEDTECFVDQ